MLAMGRAMMNIAAVFAQLERETIAERIKDNMYMLAKDGHWLGGTTPLGYKSVKRVSGDKTYYTLDYDEIVSDICGRLNPVFRIFAEAINPGIPFADDF